jgi:hypothetical protein
MFVVLSGKVSLDLGVDSVLGRIYGPGALVGLPSTLDPSQLQHDRYGNGGRRTRFLES